MNIPRHWARATVSVPISGQSEPFVTVAYGHSHRDHAEAERDARDRAMRVARWYERLGTRQEEEIARDYLYGDDRPQREPILRELGGGSGGADRWAVVTRNAYGAEILNCAAVAFVDVDLPEQPSGLVARLLRRSAPGADEILARLRATAEAMRIGTTIYRTAAGFRCLVTSELVDPMSQRSAELMERFGADARYRALCRVQRSFRARLTPKPWRCGAARPPVQWPFRDAEAEARHAAWLDDYRRRSAEWAVCEEAATVGPRAGHPLAAEARRVHDEACCRPGLPLA